MQPNRKARRTQDKTKDPLDIKLKQLQKTASYMLRMDEIMDYVREQLQEPYRKQNNYAGCMLTNGADGRSVVMPFSCDGTIEEATMCIGMSCLSWGIRGDMLTIKLISDQEELHTAMLSPEHDDSVMAEISSNFMQAMFGQTGLGPGDFPF